MVLSRQQKRSPNLTTSNRLIYAILTAWIKPKRLSRIAISIKPATLLKFHNALIKRKYQHLFSNKSPKKPGRKGPSQKIIDLIVVMKTRNPRFGYLRIAMQIQQALLVQEVLSKPSWQNVLTQEDKRALNVLFHGHINPYGLFPLDLSKRLDIGSMTRANEILEVMAVN